MEPSELERLINGVLRQHGPALRLYAATWTQWPDDAVQQSLVKLVNCKPPPDNVIGWLYRVVRNESISAARSEQRRRRREKKAASPEALFDASSADPSDLAANQRALTEALDLLSAEIREVVVAKIWGERTFNQIAEIAGCSASAAHRRYQSGLKQLQRSLQTDSNEASKVVSTESTRCPS